MDIATAALIFATQFTDSNYPKNWGPYDRQTMSDVVAGIVQTTQDPREVEILIKIARFESGGWRADVGTCKVKGDQGHAMGIFQVHPFNMQEQNDLCADYAKQAAVALYHVHESVARCKRSGYRGSDLLTGYTHGKCWNESGKFRTALNRWSDGKSIPAIIANANQMEAGNIVTDETNVVAE